MKKILSTVIVLLFVILSCSPLSSAETKEKIQKDRTYLISFNSYIDIEINTSVLEDPVEFGIPVNVPIDIKYWTDIPEDFLWFIPRQIRNLILFGQIIDLRQKIHLDILNPPDWANIYFSSPDVLVDITQGNQRSNANTSLIILLNQDAPSVSYKIDLAASSDQIKRLNGFSYQESLDITPQYSPCITIESDNIIQVIPEQTIHIPINITNCGNKISRVTPILVSGNGEWTPMINPPELELPIDDSSEFDLQFTVPNDFYGVQVFQLNFKVEIYPYRSGSPTLTIPLYIFLYYP